MSAPVVPEIVAPESPAAPAAPTDRDAPSSSALADAFQQFASGAFTPTPEAPAPEPVVEAPAPTGEQPRDEAGRFVPKEEPAPIVPPVAPAPAEAATEVGEEPLDDEPDPDVLVDLMPRHQHEAPIQLAVDSKETAERLRQTLRGAMRRDEYETAMQQVNTRQSQLEEREAELIVDPLNAITGTLTPEQTDMVLLALLSDDRVYARLADKIPLLQDELGRRELRVEVKEQYSTHRQNASATLADRREVSENTRAVLTALDAIVPEHLTGAARDVWVRDARRDLADVCRQHNIRLLDPMKVPTALSARLAASGVDSNDAVERIGRAVYGRRAAPPGSSGATSAAGSSALPGASPRTPSTPKPGSRPVSALKASHDRRVAAGATAGPGVGTPAASGLPSLPTGSGLSEAFALVKSAGKR